MTARFPEPPPFPATHMSRGPVSLRYEDVTQDGRLHPLATPHALGEVLWAGTLGAQREMHRSFAREGILPILSRMVVEGLEGPIAVRAKLEGEGGYQLAHVLGPSGEIARLVLNLWVTLSGPRGRTHGPPPPGAGESIVVGRVFAEHVFTRPFAAKEARKVTVLPEPLGIPPEVVPFASAEAILELPPGAEGIDETPVVDAAPVVFGLGQTDSNQHVNSLAYPRIFEQAALRRLAAVGLSPSVLPRSMEIGYRRPCFAGESVQISLRAFRIGDEIGVVGGFSPAGSTRASVTCRMTF